MKFIMIFFIIMLANYSLSNSTFLPQSIPEDANLNFTELAVKYGHSAEQHEVVTEDGYILTLFHIPGTRKKPVLMIHGTADHAETFILRGNTSLAITLADAGHDVWIGNLRGNKFARRHLKLNPDTDKEFWNYSLHENGYYDLAASIDYVLKSTGAKSLLTIGHSLGTTVHFILLSTRPEYNEKIDLFIALAPVAFLRNVKSLVPLIVKAGPLINAIIRSHNVEEILSEKAPAAEFAKLVCSQGLISYIWCFLLPSLSVLGYDPQRVEPEFYNVVTGHYPGTISRKLLVHYNQIALNKNFAQYDYGIAENLERYGSKTPPEYDLKNVKTNIALFVAKNDPLSTVKDVEYLRTELPHVVLYHVMEPDSWNHVDFTWANDMATFLFPHIFKLLEKYT